MFRDMPRIIAYGVAVQCSDAVFCLLPKLRSIRAKQNSEFMVMAFLKFIYSINVFSMCHFANGMRIFFFCVCVFSRTSFLSGTWNGKWL
jgi:hypothetical protein